MANQLKMAEQHAIIRLAEHGWSYRRIAREMGVHRETVARYVALAQGDARAGPAPPDGMADPFVSMAGVDRVVAGDDSSKPAISITGSDGFSEVQGSG